MLAADMLVIEVPCFLHRKLENFFRARGIWKISTRGRALAALNDFLNQPSRYGEIDSEITEYGRANTSAVDEFSFANQSEQEVLGSNVFVLEIMRLVSRVCEDSPSTLSEVVRDHNRTISNMLSHRFVQNRQFCDTKRALPLRGMMVSSLL